jgi:cytochrome P450
LIICPSVLHRLPKFWGDDVDVFRPERWLDAAATQARAAKSPFAFLPFIAGSRSCIGSRFALLEMKVCAWERWCLCWVWGLPSLLWIVASSGSRAALELALSP